jgi:outer membrane immunogenic protein
MNRLSAALIAAVSAVAFTQIASAADLPSKAPPVVAPAAPIWTGWYLGLNAGGNWGTSDPTTTVIPNARNVGGPFFQGCVTAANGCEIDQSMVSSAGSQNVSTSGFTGGIHGGYNYQMNNFLLGIEADFEYFRSAGSRTVTLVSPNFPPITMTLNTNISTDWLFTVRPRLGWVSNNWLVYATGGLAVSELKASWNFSSTTGGPSSESASVSQTKAGWVAGGGVEAMLPGRWVVGAEYLYVKFNSVSVIGTNFADVGVTPAPYNDNFAHSADLAVNIVRARLSKLF